MVNKLKLIISESDKIEKMINHDVYGGPCTLCGSEFEAWRSNIRNYLTKVEDDEIKTSISRDLEGFNGYSDAKDFHQLVDDLNALLVTMEAK